MESPNKVGLAVLLAMLAFAANSLFARLALAEGSIDPIGYTGVRLGAALAILAVLAALSGRPVRIEQVVRRFRSLPIAALLLYAVTFSFAYTLLEAGVGALILFASVQISMLGWAAYRGERLAWAGQAGALIALAACAALMWPGVAAPHPAGAALMVVAGLSWGAYSLSGRNSKEPLVDTAINFLALLPIAIGMCVVSLYSADLTPIGVLWAISSGAVGSGIGYAIWYRALPNLTRTRAALVQLGVPVLAALGGIVFLGEALTTRILICTVLIFGGLSLTILAERPSCDPGVPPVT